MESRLQKQLDEWLPRLRKARTDMQRIEVKDAKGGFPSSALKSISAFANGSGGLIVLGLEEPGFTPTGADADKLASDLASQCDTNLEPRVLPEVEICEVDGQQVVVAAVDELDAHQKPCFVIEKGQRDYAYLRSHDGNRRFTPYEHHAVEAAKGQPVDDQEPVKGVGIDHLDSDAVQVLLQRVRAMRGQAFRGATEDEILRMLGVLVNTQAGEVVTMAGLFALGRYPQQFFPRLGITFAAYPTETGEPLEDGTRLRDNQPIDGSIPMMLNGAFEALQRNMLRRAVISGMGREDRWDYPLEAIREVVINALIHRDYHSAARGQSVMMSLYPDRLEIISPGGIFGAIDPAQLMNESVSAARNVRLAKLLQDVVVLGTNETVCENVGSGLIAVAARLRSSGLPPPEIDYTLSTFKVVFRNHTLLDEDAVKWLGLIAHNDLSDRQRLALAYARQNGEIDNQRYRALTGCQAYEATQDLTDLGRRDLLRKSGDRRWATWHLPDRLRQVRHPRLEFRYPKPLTVERSDADEPSVGLPDRDAARWTLGPPTPRQGQVLDMLADGPMSSLEIAERLGVTRGAVHQLLRSLEDRGLVQPTRSDRRSRYQQWVRTYDVDWQYISMFEDGPD